MSHEYAREWISKAEADRHVAQRCLEEARSSPGQADIACFHAQQCAEKYIKAVLVSRGIIFSKIHDLLELVKLMNELKDKLNRDDLGALNQYSVDSRYPGAFASYAEAEEAVRAMERVIFTCDPFLGEVK
jgi:HEPN domain-containing protein